MFHLITYLFSAGVVDTENADGYFHSDIVMSEDTYSRNAHQGTLLGNLICTELVLPFHIPHLGLAICTGCPHLGEYRKPLTVGYRHIVTHCHRTAEHMLEHMII